MDATPPAVRGSWTRAAAITSVVALIGLGLAWELWLAPTGQRHARGEGAAAAAAAPGLLRNRLYTYRWLSLMVWLYFIEGVVRAAGDRGLGATLAALEIALCLTLFIACAAHVRARDAGAARKDRRRHEPRSTSCARPSAPATC